MQKEFQIKLKQSLRTPFLLTNCPVWLKRKVVKAKNKKTLPKKYIVIL